MSDIEIVVNAIQESGPGAAATVGGLWALKRLLGPSLDEVGTRLQGVARRRLDNLAKIGSKADALSPTEDAFPHIRVAQRVLNDATLYDDDVQQTYVAGMLAGSRNSDGSDDRPIFFLTVIDGLTASQLRVFHIFYAAAAQSLRGAAFDLGGPLEQIEMRVDDVNANILRMLPDPEPDIANASEDGLTNLLALEHVGLIANLGMDEGPDGLGRIQFMTTRIGSLLYDWAHGISDGSLSQFGTRDRPDIGLPEMVFSTL